MSDIDPSTIKAYLETNYYIAAPAPFVFQVGVPSEALARACAQHSANCCAFVTACNPYSLLIDEQTNAERQAELARELEQRGLPFFHGIGRHPSGSWPAETSYLVLGLPLSAAKTLGEKYRQNAILWCGPDAVPELILLR